jgi:DNA (cytosine-5)-methyltransferase 1
MDESLIEKQNGNFTNTVLAPVRVLNLYAGIGGNRKLWDNVEVTAIEFNDEIASIYKDLNPNDNVIVADAHEYLIENYMNFDFIWSSPPCQSHSKFRFMCSKMGPGTRGNGIKKYIDFKLWQEIIFLKHYAECKWVVENVVPYYEPFIQPTTQLQRHLIWSNFRIAKTDLIKEDNLDIKKSNRKNENFDLTKYNIKHRKDQILNNCVNPDLGLYIFEQFLGQNRKAVTNQNSLFGGE